jgi:pilus assembly protein CpaB
MGKTATLELSPAQAEAIAAGQASGILSLSLRSITDSEEESEMKRPGGGYVRIFHGERSEMVRF